MLNNNIDVPKKVQKKHKRLYVIAQKLLSETIIKDGCAIHVTPLRIVESTLIKNIHVDNFNYMLFGFEPCKKVNKPQEYLFDGLNTSFRFIKGNWILNNADIPDIKERTILSLSSIFDPLEKVEVHSKGKGKGFSGVMKRWGFSGGPASHGATLFHRRPGSIGQEKTPGRVFKKKKMPGRLGSNGVFLPSCLIVDIKDDIIYLKGAIPGARRSYCVIGKKLCLK